MNNFNRIATIYDPLARFFFGRSVVKCQTEFLHLIPEYSDILILGGGTGWIIEAVKSETNNCRIWYVEQSSRMISLAKSKPGMSDVVFICGSIVDIPANRKFDVIITNFFLDLFPEVTLYEILKNLKISLKTGGYWMVSDFVNCRRWHGVYLGVMYGFFRVTAGMETKRLPRWEVLFARLNLIEGESKFFYCRFIRSVVYKKATSFD